MLDERLVPIKFLHAIERQRPLCPDHRDKQLGKECLACMIEALERQLVSCRQLLRVTADMIAQDNNCSARWWLELQAQAEKAVAYDG